MSISAPGLRERMRMISSAFLDRVEQRRQAASTRLDPGRRNELGQFFTPDPLARFLASMFELRRDTASLLDPGAGIGSLTAAFVDRWVRESGAPLTATAHELDPALKPDLEDTLRTCKQQGSVKTQLLTGDFIEWGTKELGRRSGVHRQFDFIVMNPPYRKLGARSEERRRLAPFGADAPNLYAAFIAVAVRLLAPSGQLVAITPRSFANGPYFRSFRRDLLARVAFKRIHIYDSREAAFADASVLQENVVFLAHRGRPARIEVSSSTSPASSAITTRRVSESEVVRPDDPEQFIHLTPDALDATVSAAVATLPSTLGSLGISVSTGRVVDFRSREHLRYQPRKNTAPLIHPTHLTAGRIVWPKDGRKAESIRVCHDTTALLLPAGCYVLVKRFSAKEERRRVSAALVRPGDLPGEWWGFENHLNVLHCSNAGLDCSVATGLAVWLNSTAVDTAFRQFSGHTQVNATDIRSLRFPSADQLVALGEAAGESVLTQEKIDGLVGGHVSQLLCP
jgi:adenine-specific DNA-methyltransferase